MIIEVPQGKRTVSIVLADSIRDLSAANYMLMQQAWAREVGIGSDMYAQDGHLARLGMFLAPDSLPAARIEYSHTVMGFTNLTKEVPTNYRAAVLAPLVVRIDEVAHTDKSEAGLAVTAAAILASGITQGQLVDACEQSKKNFQPLYQ
jgi:hypothetical protein